MAQRKATMGFRLLGVLRREVGLELLPGVDLAGVRGAVRLGAGQEVVLDGLQALGDGRDELGARHAGQLGGRSSRRAVRPDQTANGCCDRS
mgnify:CR=1 FL=1